jgi:MtaA/CmuA family methyltransferase
MNLVEGKEVDRPPATPILMQFAAKYIGAPYSKYCTDYCVLVESHLRCYEEFGFDMLMTLSDAFRETADFGAKISFPYDDLPICKDYIIQEPADLKKLKIPTPKKSSRMLDRIKAIELYKQRIGNEVPILGWIEGCFAELCDLHGVNETMLDLVDRPEFVVDAMEIILEVELAFAKAQIEAGADFIGVGDAAASLVSGEMYQQYILPFEQRQFTAIHSFGAKGKLHICGNTNHLLDYMHLSGAEIIDLDWMVDIATARQKFGLRQIICGNFDPVAILMQGTPELIIQKSLECYQSAGKNFILSPGCEVPKDTPIDNLRALCNALIEG